jgi:hypothetical protein
MKQAVSRALLISCLVYSSTLKMEAICSSETSVDFLPDTRQYILEYIALYVMLDLRFSQP